MTNIEAARRYLTQASVEAIILTRPANVRWATGFESSNALVYIDNTHSPILVTDPRYEGAAKRLSGITVVVARQQTLTTALKPHLTPDTKRIGFEADHLSAAAAGRIKQTLTGYELISLTEVLRDQRAIKTAAEIAQIAHAQRATDAAFTEIIDWIKPGVTEKAVAAELVYRQLQHGADGISPEFWPVVAFGANAALPHAHAGEAKLKHGQAVLLDFGCTTGGYHSDMTRTLFCGQPDARFQRLYDLVLQAQQAAIAAVRAGEPANLIDAAYRDPIEQAGYEIPHASHGVGLEIHEWPHISPRNDTPLPEHAVITIEPGVYLPGEFGIRIEDIVVVEKDGCRNLTKSPKELIVI